MASKFSGPQSTRLIGVLKGQPVRCNTLWFDRFHRFLDDFEFNFVSVQVRSDLYLSRKMIYCMKSIVPKKQLLIWRDHVVHNPGVLESLLKWRDRYQSPFRQDYLTEGYHRISGERIGWKDRMQARLAPYNIYKLMEFSSTMNIRMRDPSLANYIILLLNICFLFNFSNADYPCGAAYCGGPLSSFCICAGALKHRIS